MGKAIENKKLNIEDEIGRIGFLSPVEIDYSVHKKVLITGTHSYLGESFEKYAQQHYCSNFDIDKISMRDGTWKDADFIKRI